MFGQTVGWHPESRTVHRRRQSEYRSAPYCASLRLYERHPFEQAFLSSDRQTGKVAALYPALLQPDAYCRDGGACSGHAHPWNLRQGLNGLIGFHPFHCACSMSIRLRGSRSATLSSTTGIALSNAARPFPIPSPHSVNHPRRLWICLVRNFTSCGHIRCNAKTACCPSVCTATP